MSKPLFLYCTGTAYALDLFGEGIKPSGSGAPVTLTGLDGKTYTGPSYVTNDPFWQMLDSDLWDSQKVEYPAAIFPFSNSVDYGVKKVIEMIKAHEGKFALGGYSQGAMVMSIVYDEIRYGSLKKRRKDLVAGVVFGNPLRYTDALWPEGSWSGRWDVTDSTTGGHGCFPANLRMKEPPEDLWWEFVNEGDIITAVGDTTGGTGGLAMQAAASILTLEADLSNIVGLLTGHTPINPVPLLDRIKALPHLNGHMLYPVAPPPGNPRAGMTSYQIALTYLREVGTAIRDAPTTAPDGAFTVGGGSTKFGQNLTEAGIKDMFTIKMPGDGVGPVQALREALHKLPLDTLRGWRGAIGGTNADFASTDTAVEWILSKTHSKGSNPDGSNNHQDLIDKIHEALTGDTTKNHPLDTVRDNLKDLVNNVVDGLTGNHGTPSTDKLPSDIKNAGTTLKDKVDATKDKITDTINKVWDGLTGNSGTPSTGKEPADIKDAASVVKSNTDTATTNANTANTNANTAKDNVQQTVDNIHQAIHGGSDVNKPLISVKHNLQEAWSNLWDGLTGGGGSTDKLPADLQTAATALKSVATTADTNASAAQAVATSATLTQENIAGNNLVISPNFDNTLITRIGFGSPLPSHAYANEEKHLGNWCYKFSTNSATYQGVYLGPTMSRVSHDAKPGEVFLASVMIKAKATNNMSAGNVALIIRWFDRTNVISTYYKTMANSALAGAGWQELSGVATAPANTDSVQVIVVADPSTPTGNVYYIDSAKVTEETHSQATKDDLQQTVDNIHQAIQGGTSVGNTVASVKSNLNQAWANIWDGLTGGVGTVSKIPADVATAAGTLVSTANNAQSTANTANAVATGTQTTIEAISGHGNLVISPNFDVIGITRVGWGSTPPTHGYSSAQKWIGNWSYQWTTTVADWQGVYLAPTQSKLSYDVRPGDGYRCTAMIKPKTGNGTAGTVRLQCRFYNNGAYLSDVVSIINNSALSAWVEIGGYVVVPANADTMQVFVISDNATAVGNTYYIDAAIVREESAAVAAQAQANTATTNAATAQTTANTANSAAGSAQTTANSASTSASTANTSVQATIDGIVQAVDGSVTTGNAHNAPKSKLLQAWANIFDGHNGTTGSTSKLPSDVQTAAGTVRSTATTAGTNASTAITNASTAQTTANSANTAASNAQTTANTANSTANTVTTNHQTTVDAIVQAVDGSATTNNAHNAPKSKLMQAWANIWDGHNGTTGSTSKLPSDIKTAAGTVRSTATTASTNATTAQTTANTANTTANTANTTANTATTNLQTVVDGVVQAVDGGTATGAVASTTKTKLALAWANIWDGHNGTTGATSKLPSDIKTAAGTVRTTANNGVTNAATAQTTANTATTNIQTTWNNLVSGMSGATVTGQTAANVLDATKGNSDTLSGHGSSISAIQAQLNGGTNSGTSVNVDFSTMSNAPTTLGSSFTQTYSGANTAVTLGVVSGAAAVSVTAGTTGNRSGMAIYNTKATVTDYQLIQATAAAGQTANSAATYPTNYLFGRVDSGGQNYVYVKATNKSVELGYAVAGARAVWQTFTTFFPITAGVTFTLQCGTTLGARTYRVFVNTMKIIEHIEVGTSSSMGASNRYAGFGFDEVSQAANDYAYPATLRAWALSDNSAASVVGSGFRAFNSSTANVATVAGFQMFPNSFFNSTDILTPDYTYSAATNNKLTVNADGWYLVEIQTAFASTTSMQQSWAPVIYKNGAFLKRGPATIGGIGIGNLSPIGAGDSFIIYLKANDYIQPGYWMNTASGNMVGDAAGNYTFFEVTLLNRSTN